MFLERGIRATTAEVAEQAGVSEGSIFHHFKTKEALFRKAMQLDHEDVAALFVEAIKSLDGLELRPALEKLATRLLEIGRQAIPLMMMAWSNPVTCATDHLAAKNTVFRTLFLRVIGFFEERKQKGELRNVDPEIVARTFMGAIHHYTMVRLLADELDHVMIPEGMFVRGLVDVLVDGAGVHGEIPLPSQPRAIRGT